MISVEHLSKRYGDATVVDDVSFTCEPGTVTGFVGPNGAGKSTTLRMLCGLARPSSGAATVAGRAYRDLPNPGRTVGVLLDASAQHPGRSGRETLALSARVLGVDPARVGQLLELVGLPPSAARKRVRAYSLGMRQRLGLAHAMLGDPPLLVLDEPANGLDPEGIAWMRHLLRGVADRGGTVLLSSHLLREVEAVADQLVVIGGGRVVAQGGAAALLAGHDVIVRALDRPALLAALGHAGLAHRPSENGALLVHALAEEVGRATAAAGVALVELRPAEGGLEELFLRLTGPAAASAATDQRHLERTAS